MNISTVHTGLDDSIHDNSVGFNILFGDLLHLSKDLFELPPFGKLHYSGSELPETGAKRFHPESFAGWGLSGARGDRRGTGTGFMEREREERSKKQRLGHRSFIRLFEGEEEAISYHIILWIGK